jgi:hypothetical protein
MEFQLVPTEEDWIPKIEETTSPNNHAKSNASLLDLICCFYYINNEMNSNEFRRGKKKVSILQI